MNLPQRPAATAGPARVSAVDADEACVAAVDAGPRVLLLGASGRLGAAIASALRAAPHRVVVAAMPSRAELALDPHRPHDAAERWLGRWPCDVVVNCIAISDVDQCEREPAFARQMNTELPAALARATRGTGARLIHFSSDFVFDGALRRPYREDDPAEPISVYGTSKLESERAISAEACSHWIFRVSWLYGATTGNLAADLLATRHARREFRLADDRFGVPNPVQLLAAEVVECIASSARANAEPRMDSPAHPPPSGIYHLSSHGVTTWYGFGLLFLREAVSRGLLRAEDAPRIEAMREAQLQRAARRPTWSALDPGRYERSFGRTMPDWFTAIRFALDE